MADHAYVLFFLTWTLQSSASLQQTWAISTLIFVRTSHDGDGDDDDDYDDDADKDDEYDDVEYDDDDYDDVEYDDDDDDDNDDNDDDDEILKCEKDTVTYEKGAESKRAGYRERWQWLLVKYVQSQKESFPVLGHHIINFF